MAVAIEVRNHCQCQINKSRFISNIDLDSVVSNALASHGRTDPSAQMCELLLQLEAAIAENPELRKYLRAENWLRRFKQVLSRLHR